MFASRQATAKLLPLSSLRNDRSRFDSGFEHRVDRIAELGADARYRFNEWLALDFRFDVIRRRSVIPQYQFTDYRIGVSVLLGQRGSLRDARHISGVLSE